jgi:hypothetical protein
MSFCTFLAQGWNAVALAALVGAAIAVIIEFWAGYQDLAAKWKQLVFLGLCLLFSFVMWLAAGWQGCAGVPDWWTVLLAALEASGIAFGAGTLLHRVVVALGLGYKSPRVGAPTREKR